jgi:hypothetical protein
MLNTHLAVAVTSVSKSNEYDIDILTVQAVFLHLAARRNAQWI